MKQTKYICDICRDEKDRNHIIGFEFASTPAKVFRVGPVSDCERHICKTCLRGMSAFADDVEPKAAGIAASK
jgi:hypothetical protein